MSTTPSAFITSLYSNVLRRSVAAGTATNTELLGWDSQISAGTFSQAQVTNLVINSAEAQTIVNPVIRIYQTFFNRVPDAGGLDFWVAQVRNGTPLSTVSNGFANASEFTAAYGAPSASTVDSFLTALYLNVLGRNPDSGGFLFWKSVFAGLGSGVAAAASIGNSFASSAEFLASSATSITNLLTTAASTGSLGSGPLSGTGGTGAGSTFTLTTGVDSLTGTSGNDTFLADNTGASVTASSTDQVSAGFGTDTLKITSANTAALDAIALPQLTSVEVLQLVGGKMVGATSTLDVSSLIGVTGLVIDTPLAMANADKYTIKTSASQSLTLVKVAGTGTVGNNSTIAVNGPSTIVLDTVGSSNGAVSLDLTSAGTSLTLTTSGTISDVALTAANIARTQTSGASKITLMNSGATLNTLTITGDRNLTLTEGLGAVTTVNASAATGYVTLDVSGATIVSGFTFTGGSGNDVLVLKAGALAILASASQLDGGAGTDILATSESSTLTTAQITTINAVRNFESLGFSASGSGVDISKLTSINSFKVMAGNYSESFTNALATSKFTVDISSGAGTLSIGNKVGEAATTVSVENNSTGAQTLAKLDVSSIASIALTSTGAAGATNVITDIVNADNSSITITGAVDLTITNKLLATSTGSKLDASSFTGKLSVIGSIKNDILIGGSAADTLQAAPGSTLNQADTLTGGAGADKFKLVATGTNSQVNDFATLMKESAGTTAILRITDFVAGTDKFQLEIDNTAGSLVAGTSVTVSTAQTIASAADLTAVYAAITPINASVSGAALSAVVVTVSSGAAAGTYLYVNDETANVNSTNDMLINITGVSGTITSADFILA